jgi:hypothetical protein
VLPKKERKTTTINSLSPLLTHSSFFVLLCFFETGSYYIAQVGLELMILLPQLTKCWDCRHTYHTISFPLTEEWDVSFDW